MSKDYTKLSAYVDGELTPDEVNEIQALLDGDTDFAAELEFIEVADVAAKTEFDDILNEPILFDLIAQIEAADLEPKILVVANSNVRWQSIAAAVLFMLVGGISGYVINDQTAPEVQIAISDSWLNHVASYHSIYANQKCHLVEVGANESDHIKNLVRENHECWFFNS